MPAVHRPVQTHDRFVECFGLRPVTYAEALSVGLTRSSLRSAVARGLLHAPRRGLLQAVPAPATADARPVEPRGRGDASHVESLRSALRTVSPRALASHESAAILWGIGCPSPRPPAEVSLVVPGGVDYVSDGVRVRGSGVPMAQRDEVDGIPVTSLARTAVDLARGRRLPSALAPLDSAARLLIARATAATGNDLRRAVLDRAARSAARDELRAALADCYGWPGTLAVRHALPFVDPAAESPLESRSRGWFLEAGLGPLSPGTPVACAGTTYWADFCDERRRVIGEADGWGKYGETPTAMRDVWEQERDRQHRLEARGWAVVRWYGSEPRAAVVGRMASALAHATLSGVR